MYAQYLDVLPCPTEHQLPSIAHNGPLSTHIAQEKGEKGPAPRLDGAILEQLGPYPGASYAILEHPGATADAVVRSCVDCVDLYGGLVDYWANSSSGWTGWEDLSNCRFRFNPTWSAPRPPSTLHFSVISLHNGGAPLCQSEPRQPQSHSLHQLT